MDSFKAMARAPGDTLAKYVQSSLFWATILGNRACVWPDAGTAGKRRDAVRLID